jgi:type IV secretion system protein VirD4
MVSRQETARPLLTQGEVMQLPATDALVLIAGMAPIRAKKLRHYEDRNFRARLAPPPELADGDYADKPQTRPDDWATLVHEADTRLAGDDDTKADEDGGLQQQRHPGASEETPKKPEPAKQLDLLGLEKDDADPAIDKRAMDQVRTVGTVVRAHTLNQGRDRDTLPSF